VSSNRPISTMQDHACPGHTPRVRRRPAVMGESGAVLQRRSMLARMISACAVVLSSATHAADKPALPYRLPATLVANRFFVQPVTDTGKALHLFTDTGGGLLFTPPTAEALGIEVKKPEKPGDPAGEIAWPTFGDQAWIPAPAQLDGKLPVLIPPPNQGLDLGGGMLGAPWFADRCWEFDYPAGTLTLLPNGKLPKVAIGHQVKLGFQAEDGKHTTHFPRITVRIDGEPLELLFDTGATSALTPEALATIADGGAATRGSSFITTSTAKRWRERHPDWLVIEKGEQGTKMDLVRAADVEVGGYSTGPVWFAVRPDDNFGKWMSQWMDQPIVGALGGNALRGFRVTVDYLSETATFEKPAK